VAFWADARRWASHERFDFKADTRESTTITLRFDPRMLARIKDCPFPLSQLSEHDQTVADERLEKEM
jgi:hypothetical protein